MTKNEQNIRVELATVKGIPDMTTYYSTVLQSALYLAIKAQYEIEKSEGYTRPSAMLATWEQMLKELQAGEQILVHSD